jgi:hypothetical protein
MRFTKEDADKIKQLITAGGVLSNIVLNLCQVGTISGSYDHWRKQWDDAIDAARPVLARMRECPVAFDPIEMGC